MVNELSRKTYDLGKILFIFVESQCRLLTSGRGIINTLSGECCVTTGQTTSKYQTKKYFLSAQKKIFDEKYFSGVSSGSGSSDTASGSDDKCESPTPSGEHHIKSGIFLIFMFSPAATASHGSSNTVKRRPEAGGARVTRPRHLKQKKDAGYKTGASGECLLIWGRRYKSRSLKY